MSLREKRRLRGLDKKKDAAWSGGDKSAKRAQCAQKYGFWKPRRHGGVERERRERHVGRHDERIGMAAYLLVVGKSTDVEIGQRLNHFPLGTRRSRVQST